MNKVYPNFLIIGANKAGTSSLHEYLGQHPEIFMSSVKEPMYFRYAYSGENLIGEEEHFEDGTAYSLKGYLNLFEKAGNAKAIGESSTTYLANPDCAIRIREFNPDMKIIAVLRNPIDRAFSNYKMYINWGIEDKSFNRVVKDEVDGKKTHSPQGRKYLELGLYANSILKYLDTFGKEQMRIFLYEDLKSPSSIYKEIFTFLNVNPDFEVDDSLRHNVPHNLSYNPLFRSIQKKLSSRNIPNSFIPNFFMPKIDNESMRILQDFYRDDIRKLEEIISKDLSHWQHTSKI